jgi:hypothetical protein
MTSYFQISIWCVRCSVCAFWCCASPRIKQVCLSWFCCVHQLWNQFIARVRSAQLAGWGVASMFLLLAQLHRLWTRRRRCDSALVSPDADAGASWKFFYAGQVTCCTIGDCDGTRGSTPRRPCAWFNRLLSGRSSAILTVCKCHFARKFR